ncbi:MAG: DNA polymerase I [Parachlamydiaceae bacterium]|nr:DNA polymerase I [Parachlamydiaceae bacterium]
MDKIYILDASGFLYRSYYAIRSMTNAKGESTNALFGFIRSVLKIFKDFDPTHIVSVFDGPNNAIARTKIYADYKAHRKGMPPDLIYQIQWAQEFCHLMGIPLLIPPNVEADDTIGTVAQWGASLGAHAYLCTSDKDMCQLVTDQIHILNTHKDNLILTPKEVEEQFGVRPDQMIDFLAITGDASDNVPGLPGFGPKTAVELLKTFGNLDYLLAHPRAVPGKKKQDTIVQYGEQALLSRKLVTIDTNVPVPLEIEFYRRVTPSFLHLKDFYAGMNFNSLIREMEPQLSELPAIVHAREVEEVHYILVDDEKALDDLIDYLSMQKEVCIDTETTSVLAIQAELVGIGLGVEQKKAWYIPTNGKLGIKKVLEKLKPLLENPNIQFFGHNLKYDYHVLLNYGIKFTLGFDTILASYLLNSHNRQHSLDYLTLEIFDKVKIPIQELIGKGKNQISMADVPLEKICEYCCEDVDYTIRLKEVLSHRLQERGLVPIMNEIESPLLPILAQMERHGIFVDVDKLNVLSKEIVYEIHKLEKNIYDMAGEEFNLNSPKQLSHILFHKLEIRPPKKTATGHSTNADVLESLSADYPIANKLLEYRTLEKLRSTYIDTLPEQVNPKTRRIHCNFNQVVAATGRLSCQDPNLQNIPVRTPLGRNIREAFRPQHEGWSFLAADYSQIELRLLAHLSEDTALMDAFKSNEDIHAYTASLIFGVPLNEVTPEQRHQAKAVNFGIIYGQQAFGLAQELGIDNKIAAIFIQMYFERYKKVKEFLEFCKTSAKESGRAVTLLGRERLIPEINSKNGMLRMAAERLAVNTPIQGTQADLIKMAMIRIDKRLREEQKRGFMILQIHDELIFEVPNEELESVSKLVKETMEGVVKLKVPLIVDIHIGKNWKEC